MPEPKYVIIWEPCIITKGCSSINSYSIAREKYLENSMKIELGLNERIGVLLPTTSFMFDAKIHTEIMIKEFFINHHLLQRSLRNLFKYKNSRSS
ncbi:hypothetical protein H5410_056293 [Solanum commersonii]|uniref:Uncharacterized protein n=1 Tax=Solanum commersonii TaxID=4109 RepID=A0A9J5WLR1_SOLCO|nr:hypothetical protein H5410_056293 [Solanum commersonii]